jgi:hypothetical protein
VLPESDTLADEVEKIETEGRGADTGVVRFGGMKNTAQFIPDTGFDPLKSRLGAEMEWQLEMAVGGSRFDSGSMGDTNARVWKCSFAGYRRSREEKRGREERGARESRAEAASEDECAVGLRAGSSDGMYPVRNAGGGKSWMRVMGWELQPEGLAEGRRMGGWWALRM